MGTTSNQSRIKSRTNIIQGLSSSLLPPLFSCRLSFSLFLAVLSLCLYSSTSLYSSRLFASELSSKTSETSKVSNTKTIGISQIVEHPALHAVREGIMEALKENGYEEGKNLTVLYENAQGNISVSTQIATKLISESIDVGVAISTPSAQTLFYAAKRGNHHIPIVFTAVSDPIAAKLEPGDSAYPITGVTDSPNLEALLEVMAKMLPNLKTLGLMYNSAEVNSVSTITQLKKMLQARGIKAVEVTVNSSSDVAQATQSLIGKVDALYFPQDNTVVSALETIVNIAQQSSPRLPVILPIFASDPVLVKKGVLAAVGFDYKDVGIETGKIIARVLNGEEANKIPITTPKHLKSLINVPLAKKLGLTIPKEFKHSEIQLLE